MAVSVMPSCSTAPPWLLTYSTTIWWSPAARVGEAVTVVGNWMPAEAAHALGQIGIFSINHRKSTWHVKIQRTLNVGSLSYSI